MGEITLKSFVDKISRFAHTTGCDQLRILEDLLDYIIGNFSTTRHVIPHWSYTEVQNEFFFELMKEYLNLCDTELSRGGWYDAWGDLFMELKGNSAGYRNQFFTPPSLANLASRFTVSGSKSHCNTFGNRVTIGDLTCGSGRMLLAAHWTFYMTGQEQPYLIAEDIDSICCKMTAVNMAIHGCYGEVICHDSLMNPKSINAGYIINEWMYPFKDGIPSIRITTDKQRFVFNFCESC